jgi:hypothetical protein
MPISLLAPLNTSNLNLSRITRITTSTLIINTQAFQINDRDAKRETVKLLLHANLVKQRLKKWLFNNSHQVLLASLSLRVKCPEIARRH